MNVNEEVDEQFRRIRYYLQRLDVIDDKINRLNRKLDSPNYKEIEYDLYSTISDFNGEVNLNPEVRFDLDLIYYNDEEVEEFRRIMLKTIY